MEALVYVAGTLRLVASVTVSGVEVDLSNQPHYSNTALAADTSVPKRQCTTIFRARSLRGC